MVGRGSDRGGPCAPGLIKIRLMDRNTSKKNFTTGMLLGATSASIFALTFVFAVLYIAN